MNSRQPATLKMYIGGRWVASASGDVRYRDEAQH